MTGAFSINQVGTARRFRFSAETLLLLHVRFEHVRFCSMRSGKSKAYLLTNLCFSKSSPSILSRRHFRLLRSPRVQMVGARAASHKVSHKASRAEKKEGEKKAAQARSDAIMSGPSSARASCTPGCQKSLKMPLTNPPCRCVQRTRRISMALLRTPYTNPHCRDRLIDNVPDSRT